MRINDHHRPMGRALSTSLLGLAAALWLAAGCGESPVGSQADAVDGDTGSDVVSCSDGLPCEEGICHPTLGACVQCLDDDQCDEGHCHPETLVCVGCWKDEQCEGRNVCATSGVCVECTRDEHCPGGMCNEETGGCVGDCGDDEDCDDEDDCTVDRCVDGACSWTAAADGVACEIEEGECERFGACASGVCVSDDPTCCDELECEGEVEPEDTDGDGCPDRCGCPEGWEHDGGDGCVCALSCLAGSVPVDADGDACPERCDPCPEAGPESCPDGSSATLDANGCFQACTCDDPDCVACSGAADCEAEAACEGASCVFGACELPDPESCPCVPVECEGELVPDDLDGDDCDESCVCPDSGELPGPDGSCETCTCDPEFGVCAGETCTCEAGLRECSGTCIDTDTDPLNCGDCGLPCGEAETCVGGFCVCWPGFQRCGEESECVDTSTDPEHCGGCNSPCEETCYDGQCQAVDCAELDPAALACGTEEEGACLLPGVTDSSPRFCGGCEGECGAGQLCAGGTCAGYRPGRDCTACPCADCAAGETCCAHPGAAGAVVCVSGAGAVCP